MKTRPLTAEERLAALRESFDASFAAPPPMRSSARRGMLAIRAGTGHFAVPIAELGGVEAARKIVPLPGAASGLLGLAGVRRHLVAVYWLAELLGCPSGQAEPRWFLLVGQKGDVALAIEELEAYLQVDDSLLRPVTGEGADYRYVREVLARDAAPCGVLRVPLLVEDVLRAHGLAEVSHEAHQADPGSTRS